MTTLSAAFVAAQREIILERIERYNTMGRNTEIVSDTFRNSYLANKFKFSVPNGQRALSKILQGMYNTCDDCGDDIGEERLAAVPAALLCLSCQEKNEKK